MADSRRGRGRQDQPIEIGTAAIDMRYENPLYMVEEAGAADLIGADACNLGSAGARPSW
jgi:hypothetical protein